MVGGHLNNLAHALNPQLIAANAVATHLLLRCQLAVEHVQVELAQFPQLWVLRAGRREEGRAMSLSGSGQMLGKKCNT